jgi:predicted membrane-bound mannosyltransferase
MTRVAVIVLSAKQQGVPWCDVEIVVPLTSAALCALQNWATHLAICAADERERPNPAIALLAGVGRDNKAAAAVPREKTETTEFHHFLPAIAMRCWHEDAVGG